MFTTGCVQLLIWNGFSHKIANAYPLINQSVAFEDDLHITAAYLLHVFLTYTKSCDMSLNFTSKEKQPHMLTIPSTYKIQHVVSDRPYIIIMLFRTHKNNIFSAWYIIHYERINKNIVMQ